MEYTNYFSIITKKFNLSISLSPPFSVYNIEHNREHVIVILQITAFSIPYDEQTYKQVWKHAIVQYALTTDSVQRLVAYQGLSGHLFSEIR